MMPTNLETDIEHRNWCLNMKENIIMQEYLDHV